MGFMLLSRPSLGKDGIHALIEAIFGVQGLRGCSPLILILILILILNDGIDS
jgi:hypothetical protein